MAAGVLQQQEREEERRRAGEVIRARREQLGFTQEQVVRGTTISTESSLSAYESGKLGIGRSKHLPSLAAFLRLTEEHLRQINPSAVIELSLPPASGKSSGENEVQRIESDFIMKPVYLMASAGRPVAEMSEVQGISPLPVRRSDLRPGTELFQVVGESMQVGDYGGILPGDVVFVDTQDRDAVPERVYVIHIPGDGVTLKRVRSLAGALWLFSDNPDQANYPPFQAEEARIVGRVHDLTRRPDVRL